MVDSQVRDGEHREHAIIRSHIISQCCEVQQLIPGLSAVHPLVVWAEYECTRHIDNQFEISNSSIQ